MGPVFKEVRFGVGVAGTAAMGFVEAWGEDWPDVAVVDDVGFEIGESGARNDTTLPFCTNTPWRAKQHALLDSPQQKLPSAQVVSAVVSLARLPPSEPMNTTTYQHIRCSNWTHRLQKLPHLCQLYRS